MLDFGFERQRIPHRMGGAVGDVAVRSQELGGGQQETLGAVSH